MSLTTREVHDVGLSIVKLFDGNYRVKDIFRIPRLAIEGVREKLKGKSDLTVDVEKEFVLKAIRYAFERMNFKYLPDFLIEPMVLEGIPYLLDWVYAESQSRPEEVVPALSEDEVKDLANEQLDAAAEEEAEKATEVFEVDKFDPKALDLGGEEEGEEERSEDDPAGVPAD